MLGTWFYEHPYCTDRYIVVSLSSDKCTYCKWHLIKVSAKCPQCKCKRFRSVNLYGRCFRAQTATLADDRIRMMSEVVSGIRIIKMYGWEKLFTELVNEVRRYGR